MTFLVDRRDPWQRRYCPFFFAGSVRVAAEFAERFLRRQVREIERASKAIREAGEASR